ncbi:MAG: 5-formyltetrahydrofolate cyclo-ligase [Gammaproteobacteria bacterium]
MTGKPRIPCSPDALPRTEAQRGAPATRAAPAELKAALRTRLRAQRAGFDPAHKARLDEQLCARVLALFADIELRSWGVFWPLKGEPDLFPAYEALAQRGVELFLPVVLKRDAPLDFCRWTPGETMHKDAMGIAVPEQLRLAPTPELLLIPCLGWNRAKFRLGYGGGFYDRTLAVAKPPFTVGVGYADLEAEFPTQTHDVALDVLVTERATW